MTGNWLVELIHADQVMNVRTGELLDLRAAAFVELAEGREGLARLAEEVKDGNVLFDAEIVARVDAAVRSGEIDKYTVRVGDYEIRVPSPEAGGKVNVEALRDDLMRRVAAGTLDLTEEAVDRAFKAKTTYALNRSAYGTLSKQEPELEALLKRHTGPSERRRATVTVLPGSTPVVVAADDVIEGQEAFRW
jgi:hypothetical protein